MKNVDHIIQYLSGDLTAEESSLFEKELESSPPLREEFEKVSAAYRLVREQLQKEDEEAFREKLRAAMDSSPATGRGRKWKFTRQGRFLLPVAAVLAILIGVFLVKREPAPLMDRYFDPGADRILASSVHVTRGDASSAITLYNKGAYREAMNGMQGILAEDPGNQLALLYYLLASMELDLQDEALERVLAQPVENSLPPGQSLTWYTALALVKSDRADEAALKLEVLTGSPGPYRKDAKRLHRILLK